jgi:hypothetical protein
LPSAAKHPAILHEPYGTDPVNQDTPGGIYPKLEGRSRYDARMHKTTPRA